VVAGIEAKFFTRMCELIGAPELAELQYDPARQAELRSKLESILRTRTVQEWDALLAAEETCVTRVWEPGELPAHPQHAARRALDTLHADAAYPVPCSPFVFDGERLVHPAGSEDDTSGHT